MQTPTIPQFKFGLLHIEMKDSIRMLWKSRLALYYIRSVMSYLLYSPFDAEFLEEDKALLQSASSNPNQYFKQSL